MWTINQLTEATQGKTTATGSANSFDKVILDSREVTEGDIFLCMQGEKADGHDYISGAIEKGASCIIYSDKNAIKGFENAKATFLQVDDTPQALKNLATYKRAHTKAKVIAITGSFGKTSTKEWLAYTLSHFGKTHANYKSFNAFPGMPLTLANIPDACDFVVAEIGMSSRNEIAPLSEIANPDIALITTVGRAHIQDFGSIEAIAEEKSDIFAGLKPGGCAIFPGDQDTTSIVEAKASNVQNVIVHKFGDCSDSFARITSANTLPDSQHVTATINNCELSYEIGILGAHWQKNSLAVLCALSQLGIDITKAAPIMSGFKGYSGRGQQYELELNKGGRIRIIDESYNGGPESVMAAIHTLKHAPFPGPHGRRIAVIGDMYELGELTEELHKLIACNLDENEIDLVHTSGNLARTIHESVKNDRKGIHSDNADPLSLGQAIAQEARPGDVYMVKGSRGPVFIKDGRMARVVEAIKNLGTIVKE